MTELQHQPCKRHYYQDFRQRKTDINEHEGYKKRFCYGIVDCATDEVIPECRFCDEWEMNIDFWIDEINKKMK